MIRAKVFTNVDNVPNGPASKQPGPPWSKRWNFNFPFAPKVGQEISICKAKLHIIAIRWEEPAMGENLELVVEVGL